jgi:hypothetical protein
MAHFAEIDKENKVVRVLLIPDEFEKTGDKYLSKTLGLGGKWIQTSYNSKIREKFAGIGDTYNEELDVFEALITTQEEIDRNNREFEAVNDSKTL